MNPGFPRQHTRVTATTTSSAYQPKIRFDPAYIKTIPGMLKCAGMVLGFIGSICVFSTPYILLKEVASQITFFKIVTLTGFCISGLLLLFYIFHFVEKFYRIPWLKIEFIFCVISAFFFIVASALIVSWGAVNNIFNAAGFFGFSAAVAYLCDAWLKFFAMKRGVPAQGQQETK